MSDWFTALLLFADEAAPAQNAAPPEGNPLGLMLPALFLVLILWMFMFTGPGAQRRREQKRVTDLMATLKKNDPVVTIGGILGTVVSVSTDRNEVVIKVDDNSRLRLRASAIQGVIGGGDESKDAASTK